MTDVLDWCELNERISYPSLPMRLPHIDESWQWNSAECDASYTNFHYRHALPNPVISSDSKGSSTPTTRSIMPTPPRSPPLECELDELVATIPEILERSSVKDFKDILSDIEAFGDRHPSTLATNAYTSWDPFQSPLGGAFSPQNMLKKDIMWGEGACSTSPIASLPSPPLERSQRRVSECDDARIPDPLKGCYYSDDEAVHMMPETPSGSDTDGDEADPDHLKLSLESATLKHLSFNCEHDYCGSRLPPMAVEDAKSHTESDDEVDVVTYYEKEMATISPAAQRTKHHEGKTVVISSQAAPSTMISPEVKRQLQITIQESMKNKQRAPAAPSCPSTSFSVGKMNRAAAAKVAPPPPSVVVCTSSPTAFGARKAPLCRTSVSNTVAAAAAAAASSSSSNSRTQGKPAAYTKRMREYHSEVIRSNKRKRSRSGENVEDRRNVHNNLERQRRIDLRNAFERLRQLVPETSVMEKAAKIQILRKASYYCLDIQLLDTELDQEKERLKMDLELKKRRLAELS